MDNIIDNKSDLNQHSLSKTTNYYNNIESSEELSFIGATQQITNQITTISDNNGHIRHHSIKSNRFLGTQIFIILSMLISTFFSIIIYIVLSTNFTTIEGEIKVYLATSEYNNNIIMIFNIFREYMFDKILFVKYIDLQEFLQDELKNFYTQAIESNKIVDQYRSCLPKEFDTVYDSMQHQDVSKYSKEFFETTITDKWRTCENITNEASKYVKYFI